MGTRGGGLGCACVGLGVQNLDTKGVPAASDEVVNAAGAGPPRGEGAAGTKWKDTRSTFSLLLDFGSRCLNLTCSA